MKLPTPTIKLDGFPICHGDRNRCTTEVSSVSSWCARHSGPPMGPSILRRTLNRQARTAVQNMIDCRDCEHINLNDIRCSKCAWFRGVAMGLTGIAEQNGWEGDVTPLMKMIAHHEPRWYEKWAAGSSM